MAVDQFPRGEPIVDDRGRPTQRYLQFMNDSTRSINQTETTTESIESAPTTISRLESIVDEIGKRVGDLEGRPNLAGLNTEDVVELKNLLYVVGGRSSLSAAIAELTKRVDQLEVLL